MQQGAGTESLLSAQCALTKDQNRRIHSPCQQMKRPIVDCIPAIDTKHSVPRFRSNRLTTTFVPSGMRTILATCPVVKIVLIAGSPIKFSLPTLEGLSCPPDLHPYTMAGSSWPVGP